MNSYVECVGRGRFVKLVLAIILLGCEIVNVACAPDLTQTQVENSFSWDTYSLDDDRIIGGERCSSTSSSFIPVNYQVSLQTKEERHFCGGTIIAPQFILTAAHCVRGSSPNSLMVVFGIQSIGSSNDFSGVKREVVEIDIHRLYSSQTSVNDVAILKLKDPIKYGFTAQPALLPEENEEVKNGAKLLVSGWGTTAEGGFLSEWLMCVSVPYVSDSECKRSYGNKITDSMICAGEVDGGKDSCQGDSGGPMVEVNEQGKPVVVGIVSWGKGCARPGYPGVYTQVSYFIKFINELINK